MHVVAYHGSPDPTLTVVSAQPAARQYDNATSVFGAFFAPTVEAARHYAGSSGRVYEGLLKLRNPYEMPWREFAYFQDVTRTADGAQVPSHQWAARLEELKGEAVVRRRELEAAGHDSIIVRRPRGEVYEIAVFADVAVTPSATGFVGSREVGGIWADWNVPHAQERLKAIRRQLEPYPSRPKRLPDVTERALLPEDPDYPAPQATGDVAVVAMSHLSPSVAVACGLQALRMISGARWPSLADNSFINRDIQRAITIGEAFLRGELSTFLEVPQEQVEERVEREGDNVQTQAEAFEGYDLAAANALYATSDFLHQIAGYGSNTPGHYFTIRSVVVHAARAYALMIGAEAAGIEPSEAGDPLPITFTTKAYTAIEDFLQRWWSECRRRFPIRGVDEAEITTVGAHQYVRLRQSLDRPGSRSWPAAAPLLPEEEDIHLQMSPAVWNTVGDVLKALPEPTAARCAMVAAELVAPYYEDRFPKQEGVSSLSELLAVGDIAAREEKPRVLRDALIEIGNLMERARVLSQAAPEEGQGVETLAAHDAAAAAFAALAAWETLLVDGPGDVRRLARNAVRHASSVIGYMSGQSREAIGAFRKRWWSECRRRLPVRDVTTAQIQWGVGARSVGARVPETYWHGTSREGEKILREGRLRPGNTLQTHGVDTSFTPLPDRVYLTPDLNYAVIYALGGVYAGSPRTEVLDKLILGRGDRYGYVWQTQPDPERLWPDEDSVGEVLGQLINDGQMNHWLVDLARDPLKLWDEPSTDMEDEEGTYDWEWRSVIDGVRDGLYADWVKAGKLLLNTEAMQDDGYAQQFIEEFPSTHVSHEGPIRVQAGWRFDRLRYPELGDLARFFEIAEPVVFDGNVATAGNREYEQLREHLATPRAMSWPAPQPLPENESAYGLPWLFLKGLPAKTSARCGLLAAEMVVPLYYERFHDVQFGSEPEQMSLHEALEEGKAAIRQLEEGYGRSAGREAADQRLRAVIENISDLMEEAYYYAQEDEGARIAHLAASAAFNALSAWRIGCQEREGCSERLAGIAVQTAWAAMEGGNWSVGQPPEWASLRGSRFLRNWREECRRRVAVRDAKTADINWATVGQR